MVQRALRTCRRTLVVALVICGCGPASLELSAEASRRAVPEELLAILPTDFVLVHSESFEEPISYRLWVLRSKIGEWLTFPEDLEEIESHNLPPSTLLGMIKAKARQIEPGVPKEAFSRYTHWTTGDREYQVRELVTDRGWFASVESFPR